MTVVILGGGIGGLSAAYYLLKSAAKRKVVLLEASNRLGGWIRSDKQTNGLIFEQGPRTLRPVGENGANTLNLIEELELSGKVNPILSKDPVTKNRFVYVGGQLHALPSSLRALFKTLPPFSKPMISALKQDLFANRKRIEDDSIYNFVARRFGQEIADYGISPLICGICGGDAKRISVNFLMKDFFEKEQKYGSVCKGFLFQIGRSKKQKYELNELAKRALKKEFWSSYSLQGGMEILPNTLSSKIEQLGATIMKNSPVFAVNFGKKVVETEREVIPFEHLVSTLPAYSLSKLVRNDHYPLSKELAKIPYTSVITVNLAYSKNLLSTRGFGFLVPPSENLPILGVVFDSCYAPFGDWTVLTVMMGGHAYDSFFKDNTTHEYILKIARKYVADILKIDASPDLYQINVLNNCIPQQVVGHNHRVTSIECYIDYYKLPLHLVGTAFKGTGINDTILAAKHTAENINNVK